jgi:hypothetical protein
MLSRGHGGNMLSADLKEQVVKLSVGDRLEN